MRDNSYTVLWLSRCGILPDLPRRPRRVRLPIFKVLSPSPHRLHLRLSLPPAGLRGEGHYPDLLPIDHSEWGFVLLGAHTVPDLTAQICRIRLAREKLAELCE